MPLSQVKCFILNSLPRTQSQHTKWTQTEGSAAAHLALHNVGPTVPCKYFVIILATYNSVDPSFVEGYQILLQKSSCYSGSFHICC